MNSTSSASSSSSSSTQPAEDYIQKLSQHIRYHESSLAAATLNSTLQPRRHASSSSLSPSSSSSSAWSSLSNLTHGFGLLNSTLSSSSSSNPLTLNLDPHHLYYLLLKFEEIGIRIGSLDINLLDSSNQKQSGIRIYDSTQWMIGFNSNENSRPIDKSDTISLFSNLSNLSIGSTWWLGSSSPNRAIKAISNLRSQTYDQIRSIEEEVKYLYSSFTKLPSLKLTPTSLPTISTSSQPKSMQLLEGFTDLPNQNAIPLICFKSLWTLSILDLDPRLFIGWNQLSQSLRSLEIRRSGLEDIERLLIDAVMFDVEREAKLELSQQDLADEQNSIDVKSNVTDLSVAESDQERRVTENKETHLSTSPTSLTHPPESESSHHHPSPPPSFPTLAWRFLHHLCLADNALTFIPSSALAALVSLASLDLSSNLLIMVPTGLGSLTRLKSLSLADNMIDSVLGIYQSLGNVTTINLSKNRLNSLCGLERLYSLERLDIRQNKIQDISELSRLATLPSLTNLWTSSNPFTMIRTDWRITIFNYFADENRDLDLSSHNLTLNLKLDNEWPTYHEKKLIRKLVGRSSTPDQITSTAPSRKTIVLRSPGGGAARRPRPSTTIDVTTIPSSSEDTSSPKPFVKTTSKQVVSKKDRNQNGRRRAPRIIELDHQYPKKPVSQSTETDDQTSSSYSSSHPKRIGSLGLDERNGNRIGSGSGSNDEDHLYHQVSFRKKIETLRDEVGDGWLKVLGESEFGEINRQPSPSQPQERKNGNGNGNSSHQS